MEYRPQLSIQSIRINVLRTPRNRGEEVYVFCQCVTTNTVGMHTVNIRRYALRNVMRSQRAEIKKHLNSIVNKFYFHDHSFFNNRDWKTTIPTTIRCRSNKIEYLYKKAIILGVHTNRVNSLLPTPQIT